LRGDDDGEVTEEPCFTKLRAAYRYGASAADARARDAHRRLALGDKL
jgi:hypothetical protein